MSSETRLVQILCCDWYFPIPTVADKCIEHRCIAEAINSVINYLKRVIVCHHVLVDPPVIDTKPVRPILLRKKHNWAGPFRRGGINDPLV